MDKIRKSHIIATVGAVITMGIASGSAFAGGFLDVEFSDVDLNTPLIIDNPYWPLRPDVPADCTVSDTCNNRIFTYIGETDDECVIDQISVNDPVFGATYELNEFETAPAPYDGLVAVQVVDTEWVFEELPDGVECDTDLLFGDDADEALKELTLDWYVQDDQDNIWYVGELSQNYEEDGCGSYPNPDVNPVDDPQCFEGSWEAGMPGGEDDEEVIGEAGIVVPGDEPIAGEPLSNGTYYFQEVAYEAEDMAKVLRMNARLDDFESCRKVKEWNPLEHGESVEHKWYCPDGGGLVLIEGKGGGPTEVEELVSIVPPL